MPEKNLVAFRVSDGRMLLQIVVSRKLFVIDYLASKVSDGNMFLQHMNRGPSTLWTHLSMLQHVDGNAAAKHYSTKWQV